MIALGAVLHRHTVRTAVSGILTAVAVVGALRLGVFDPIRSGLDASWVAVLGEAASRADIFGRDLVLTSGPLNSLYTRYFDSVQWPYVLLAGVLVAGSLAWSCARLASTWLVALLLPYSISLALVPDSIF